MRSGQPKDVEDWCEFLARTLDFVVFGKGVVEERNGEDVLAVVFTTYLSPIGDARDAKKGSQNLSEKLGQGTVCQVHKLTM